MGARRAPQHGSRNGHLTEFQHAVLVAVGWTSHSGATGYQIARHADREGSGGLLGYSRSQVYRELKALAQADYLDARTDESSRGVRYSLTDAGLAAVRAWVRALPSLPATGDSELVTRFRARSFLFSEDVFGDAEALAVRLENRIEDLRDHRRRTARAGDWDDWLELEYELQVSLLRAYRDWLSRVDDYVAVPARRRQQPSPSQRSLLADDPDLATDELR